MILGDFFEVFGLNSSLNGIKTSLFSDFPKYNFVLSQLRHIYTTIIGSNKDIVLSEFYLEEDTNEKFLYSIKRESEKLIYYLYHIKKIKMTKADRISFKETTHCSICGNEFKGFERKNRDHGMIT